MLSKNCETIPFTDLLIEDYPKNKGKMSLLIKSHILGNGGSIFKFLDIFPMFLGVGSPFLKVLGSLHTLKYQKLA